MDLWPERVCFLYVSDIPQVCEYPSGIVLSPCGGTFIFSFMAPVPSLNLAAGGRRQARDLSREDRRAVGPKRRQRLGANRMLFVICNVY